MRRMLVLGAALLASALIGCGSDAECAIDTDCPVFSRCEANRCVAVGARPDAGGGRMDGSLPEAGPRDGGTPDAGSDAGPAIVQSGAVVATSATFMVGTATISSHTLSASFLEAPVGSTGPCTATAMGPCAISTCPAPMGADGGLPDAGAPVDAGTARHPHAGMVSLTGGTMAVSVTPDADGAYAPAAGTTALWMGGETLSFSAVGAAVPAFTSMLTAPPRINVIAPTFPAGSSVSIDRSVPFTARWTGGAAGGSSQVVVVLSGTTMAGGSISATCSYAAPAGEGTVPVEVLGMIAPGSGSISITATSSTRVEPGGGWMIRVSAQTTGVRTGGLAVGLTDFVDPP